MPVKTAPKSKPASGASKTAYDSVGLSVDCAVFGFDQGDLKVALVRRDADPFAGKWSLPGGFVQRDESLEDAARRELRDRAGLGRTSLEQLLAFGAPNRDPRGRIVSIAFEALVRMSDPKIQEATEAASVTWHSMNSVPSLAFDHRKVLQSALERLREQLRHQPVAFELLPQKFKLSQLQHLYETVLDRELDKRNFRRKVLGIGVLLELDEFEEGVAHRAARLYRFDRKAYDALIRNGLTFAI